ncbi:hypothetical protein HMH01_00935 [Halovulum dunhuangense]|uniref:Apea-like HEPN domain-containing protein n=2 Tax=Halovulum dunhuangense TaxID=1505036 RepID=A0A849L031_9RHOB|nr:hypothetical protein [Halovulum dunhuangense]
MGLRVHRALSWMGRAEALAGQDADTAFILYWIAFNAAYADAADFEPGTAGLTERGRMEGYFARLVRLDADKRIYDAIWSRYSGPVRVLLDNRFVFEPFWRHQNDPEGAPGWQERFEAARRTVGTALARHETTKVLTILFDRLYVLRNQLVHGGATWNSGVNRQQVRDGAAILGFLVPVFIDLMMDNPAEDWGHPFYPVVPG